MAVSSDDVGGGGGGRCQTSSKSQLTSVGCADIPNVCCAFVPLTSQICRSGSSQRSRSRPSLRPRFQTCHRRTTVGSQLVSRSRLCAGEQNTAWCCCLVPQPQLDTDTSHMLDNQAGKSALWCRRLTQIRRSSENGLFLN